MIIYWESQNGDRKQWRINSFDDFEQLFPLFPRVKDIVMSSETLPDAIESTVDYLSSGTGESWTERNEDVSKALKEAGMALGIALGTMAPSNISNTVAHTQPQAQQMAKRPSVPFGQHPADRFLWNVSQVESSGGKDTDHPVVKYGLSRGDKAIGRWGLLRNTVLEMNNRSRLSGQLSPDREKLNTMSREQMNEHLSKNPDLELELARQTAQHVLKRNKGDMNKAAYAWLHGHNLHPTEIDANKITSSDYVSKFRSFDRKNPFATQSRTVAGMKKVEEDGDFEGRLTNWHGKRMEQAREPAPRDTTYVPDPGRIREKELDEKPVDKNHLIEYIKQLINNAKKAIKS
jgi:hypothetical protein